MKGPRFERIELAFGRHACSFELASADPLVIVGRNGSGKTTLIDAILRTLYGFRRRRGDDGSLFAARRPWSGDGYRAVLEVRDPGRGLLTWSRDFDDDEVVVETADGSTLFEGEANPGAGGSTAEAYRDLLRSVFGLDDLDDWARTTLVRQAALPATEFDGKLLSLVEGGHARIRAALARLETDHKELTREPVTAQGRRLNRDRPLESERNRLADARERLQSAEALERARGPAVQRLAELEREERQLTDSLERMEPALHRLHERRAAEATCDTLAERLDRLVDLEADLDGALRDREAADREIQHCVSQGLYPQNFRSRAAELSGLLARREELVKAESEAPPAGRLRVVAAGTCGLAVVGIVSALLLDPLAWVIALAGTAAAAWAVRGLVSSRREREATTAALARLRLRIGQLLTDVPDAATVTRAALPNRLETFERQEEARRRAGAAGSRIESLERRVREHGAAAGRPDRSIVHLVSDARQRLAEARTRLADIECAVRADWPGETPEDPAGVETVIHAARTSLREIRSEWEDLTRDLAASARDTVAIGRLADECEGLETEVTELETSALVHRAAYALLRDGHSEYREHDETRLVEAIQSRIRSLGAGTLDAFRADDGLGGATVELAGRRVAIDSPELSFGQRHLVKLAIRLGTADFVGAAGVTTPIVVDEPFAHLDTENAELVWHLLARVAEERQVIVATQEKETVRRLGAGKGGIDLDVDGDAAGATHHGGDVFELSTAPPATVGGPGGNGADSDGGRME